MINEVMCFTGAAVPEMKASSLLERRSLFGAAKLSIDCTRNGWDAGGSTASTRPSTAHFTPVMEPKTGGSQEQVAVGATQFFDKWIDTYQPFEQLGQGTSGVVYRARRKSDDRGVAMKITRKCDDDAESVAIAQKEFDILRNLQHPSIIKVLEFIEFPMGVALVMDFFSGSNLKCAVRKANGRRFEESIAGKIFLQLIQAIEYLHRNDIIHRDVKAQNVLVSNQLDDVRLIDFNVARSGRDGALTMTGTVDYMPPEVLLGESPSASSDVWAAGLCLYLMLCGKMPLERTTFQSRHAFGCHLSGLPTVQLPSAMSGSISGECKRVLQRCLQSDPKSRAQSHELLSDQWMRHL